jgi:hypothetical protein
MHSMARNNKTHRFSTQSFTDLRRENKVVRLFDYVMLLLCVTALLSALSRDHYLPSIGTSTADRAPIVAPHQQFRAAPGH